MRGFPCQEWTNRATPHGARRHLPPEFKGCGSDAPDMVRAVDRSLPDDGMVELSQRNHGVGRLRPGEQLDAIQRYICEHLYRGAEDQSRLPQQVLR